MTVESPTVGIAARLQSGIAWKITSQGTLQVARMVVALIVARQLAPHDWGVAAMVMVVASFATALTDNALGPALVQKPNLTEADKSTVLWLNIGIGVALTVAGIALATPLANFLRRAGGSAALHRRLRRLLRELRRDDAHGPAEREMQFRELELRQIAATIVGAATGVTIAFAHFGAWAIVGQQLAGALTSTLLLWAFLRWRPRLMFSKASLRRLGGFAGFLFGENLIYQGGSNVGNLLIGRVLGVAALGTYGLATNVILMPITKFAAPLASVFLPAFSRMSDDRERLTDAWLRSNRPFSAVTVPALAGLAALAPICARGVGPRWDSAVPVIVILAWAGIVQSVEGLMGEVLLASTMANALLDDPHLAGGDHRLDRHRPPLGRRWCCRRLRRDRLTQPALPYVGRD